MARPYKECPTCGTHALSIATRCPSCGQDLLGQPALRPEPRDGRRRRMGLGVAVAVLAAGGLVTLAVWRAARAPDESAIAAVQDEAPAALDSSRAASSPARLDSTTGEAVPRLARTWTNVRNRRSPRADVVAVLLPGDTVLADSLKGGWWRVALEGQVLGYVYAGTLLPESP